MRPYSDGCGPRRAARAPSPATSPATACPSVPCLLLLPDRPAVARSHVRAHRAYCRPAETSWQSAKRARRAAAARYDERIADVANCDAVGLRPSGRQETRHRLAEWLLAEPERVPVDRKKPARAGHTEHPPDLLRIRVVVDPGIVRPDAEERDVDPLACERCERLRIRGVAREEHATVALREQIAV